jgi:serine/threonine protein kinase/WD40 repeat protein
MSNNMTESAIFRAAANMPPSQRAAFLDDACAGDPAARNEIESLLKAHDDSCSFLQRPKDPNAQPTDDYSSIIERPGATVGPYRLMEQIGEGGFGLVFVAEQTAPVRRKVALKIIKPGMDTREIIARFEAERQALALMDHPHIAKVFDAGATPTGRPYFVMELVKGIPITEYSDQQRLSARDRLELFLSVCQAVQHAHAKGIIHRDLKPSNILVAPHDGIPVVKVIDFGVAKAIGQQLTEKTIYTRFSQMIGTPLYMSPEQAEINALDIDIRADIYSLGVLLYELLTGTTPFERTRFATAAYDEIRRIIKEEEPPKPSTRLSSLGNTLSKVSLERRCEPTRLTALVKGDLDWIVMKALEKDRSRRYETANSFAADIKRFLAEEPIEARPPSAVYRLQKLARRNKTALGTASLLALTLLVGSIVSIWQAIRARKAERVALKQQDQIKVVLKQETLHRTAAESAKKMAGDKLVEANTARDELRKALYVSSMNLAASAWQADNVSRVIELLEEQKPKSSETDLRGFEWRYWDRLCHAELRTTKFSDNPEILGAMLSADAKRLFFWTHGEADGKKCYHLQVLDALTAAKIWQVEIPTESQLNFLQDGQIAVSRDGSRFAFTHRAGGAESSKSKVIVYDLASKDPIFTTEGEYERKTSLSPDGNRLALVQHAQMRFIGDAKSANHGRITLYDLANPDPKPLLVESERVGAAIPAPPSFSPDGKRLAAIEWRDRMMHGIESSIRIWETETGKSEVDRALVGEQAFAIAFDPDGSAVAAVGMKQPSLKSTQPNTAFVTKWYVEKMEHFRPLYSVDLGQAVSAIPRFHIAFSTDGRLMSICNEIQSCAIFDDAVGVQIGAIKTTTPIPYAAFSHDGRTLTTLRTSRTAAATPDSLSGGELQGWTAPTPSTNTPADLAAKMGGKGHIAVWNPKHDRQASFQHGKRFALPGEVQDQDRAITLRDAEGRELLKFEKHAEPIDEVIFSPDGKWIISNSAHEAMIWNSATGEIGWQRTAPDKHTFGQSLQIGEFSADGKWLMLHEEGQLRIVSGDGLKEKLSLGPASTAKISHDSRSVVSFHPLGSDENGRATHGEIKVWKLSGETAEPKLLETTPFENGSVRSMACSPDNRLAAIAGGENISIVDLATGKQLKLLKVGFDLEKVLFSPDGSRFLAMRRDPRSMWRGKLPTIETTMIWDAVALAPLFELKGHSTPIIDAVFSPDGTRIATAAFVGEGRPNEIKLWDAATGRELLSERFDGQQADLRAGYLAFTADGNKLVIVNRIRNNLGLGPQAEDLIWDATPRPVQ